MIINIENELSSLKNELKNHKLYSSLKSLDDIRVFMENHVFAVWDFMSILKALQNKLTNTSVPWLPNKNSTIARFINEIVHGEESDINEIDEPKSHFEMYLDAMTQIKANKENIYLLTNSVKSVSDVNVYLDNLSIDNGVKNFTKFTFEIINSDKSHCIASAFTYGREDIIPDIFIEILDKMDPSNNRYNKLKYYLERHIEIDGDLHGPIAKQMTEELCGTNQVKWNEAIKTAKDCLQKRIQLWDSIYSQIKINYKTKLAI